MHIHLPKPMHGWREFLGEVGIIVLGVLIALGAEQVVEAWHWHHEVGELREALDHELDYNLASLRYRATQEDCVAARIATLAEWQAGLRKGAVTALPADIGRPAAIAMKTAVWNARSTEAMAHMPLAERLKYSIFYDDMATVTILLMEDREAWTQLNAFNRMPGPLSGDAALKLNELLFRVRSLNKLLASDWRLSEPEAQKMGLHPSFGADEGRFDPPRSSGVCRPMQAGS